MSIAHYPVKTLLGVGIAALLSFYGAFAFYGEQTDRNKILADRYQIGPLETRFEVLKRELPAVRVVGYISDEPKFFLYTQFVLAPVLLVEDPQQEWVVGNFAKPHDFVEFGRMHKLTLVKDYSSGVVLFRKAG